MRLRVLFIALGLGVSAACQAAPSALPSPAPTALTPTVAASSSPVPASATPELPPTQAPAAGPTSTPAATAPAPSFTATAPPTPTAAPPRLLIPALNLDRPVVTVPVHAGNWDITGLDQNVGWLETTGQKPGEALAMAFVGHITLTATHPGPFADLWRLHLNAEIIYRLGTTDYVYGVKYKVSASPDEARRLYVTDGQKLLLVTCSEWDYAAFNYSKRLIVVAQAVGQRPAP